MYGNYPDPQMMMYQNRLRQMQAQYPQPPIQPPQMYGNVQPSGLKGRIVMGIDEARAAQVDLDGTAHYFDCPSEATIYKKSIDLNGMPVFETYRRVSPQAQPKQSDVIATLQTRVEQLEKRLEGMYVNVQSNAVNSNDAGKPESDGNDATAVR